MLYKHLEYVCLSVLIYNSSSFSSSAFVLFSSFGSSVYILLNMKPYQTCSVCTQLYRLSASGLPVQHNTQLGSESIHSRTVALAVVTGVSGHHCKGYGELLKVFDVSSTSGSDSVYVFR